jgi:hypothetical protein
MSLEEETKIGSNEAFQYVLPVAPPDAESKVFCLLGISPNSIFI